MIWPGRNINQALILARGDLWRVSLDGFEFQKGRLEAGGNFAKLEDMSWGGGVNNC